VTDQQPSSENPAAAPSEGPAAQTRSGQPGHAATGAARTGAAVVANVAARFGNWLVSIGWGKFVLLSLLILVLGGMVDSMFAFHQHKHPKKSVPVDVRISVDSDGLHITAPSSGQPKPASPQVRIDDKGVRIDDKGVRIRTDKNGHDTTVVIDRNGVRVEEAPSAAGPSGKAPATPQGTSKLPQVTLPPGMLSDPDKVAQAVEAAKGEIEDIVREQVDTKVAALPRADDGSAPWPDLAELAFMMLFTLMIVKIALGSKRRAESRARAADAVAAEEGLKRQLAEAELKTMQAQVEPHFLFNTLASVDYLIETDPARASRMQKNLIQYLRAALPQMRQASSTLGQEMALCRSYLEILKVRMDDRLQFAITLPAGLSSAAFPPMMLQTLVENSIKHGLEPKPEGGALTLSADVVDGNLRVAVSDTGLGFGAAGAGGGGVGLNNVRGRLQALFGARGRLTIEPNSPSGTIATIVVPYAVGTVEAAPQASPQPA
jgi:hypothetical protein